jgi:hypothetical protein
LNFTHESDGVVEVEVPIGPPHDGLGGAQGGGTLPLIEKIIQNITSELFQGGYS